MGVIPREGSIPSPGNLKYFINCPIMQENSGSLILGAIDPSFINYQGVLIFLVLYFAAMWLMFCLWVFLDAFKRYNSLVMPVIFTLVVLPFNIPGFILYLIARPEEEYVGSHDHSTAFAGGVEVPLVKYVGEDGKIKMAINLELDPNMVTTASDMDVNVAWTSQKSNMSLQQKEAQIRTLDVGNKELQSKISEKLNSFSKKLAQSANNAKNKLSTTISANVPAALNDDEESSSVKSSKKNTAEE